MLPRNKSIFHIEEEEEERRQGERKRVRDDACHLKGLQILIIDQHSSSDRFSDRDKSSNIVMNRPSLLSIDGRRRRRTREEAPVFLKACFLCRRELSPHKDVYIYRGEQGFCSEACRSRQISLDETREMMEVNSLSRKFRPSKAAAPKIQESDKRWRILAVSS